MSDEPHIRVDADADDTQPWPRALPSPGKQRASREWRFVIREETTIAAVWCAVGFGLAVFVFLAVCAWRRTFG